MKNYFPSFPPYRFEEPGQSSKQPGEPEDSTGMSKIGLEA
jgi:hypothetical protein